MGPRYFRDASILIKILSGFLVLCFFAAAFGIYLSTAFQTATIGLDSLSENALSLSNFLQLDVLNRRQNIDVRNYVLTSDPQYVADYEKTARAFDEEIEVVKKQELDDPANEAAVQAIESASAQIKTIESSVIASTRTNDTVQAQAQFDTEYYQHERMLSDLIAKLIADENKLVDGTIAKNTALMRTFSVLSLVALAVLIAAMLLISAFFARLLSRRLKTLVITTQRIAAGELDLRAEESSKDEIGQLAEAFNAMTASLRSYSKELEAKVEERTVDLATAKRAVEEKLSELGRMNRLMVDREIKMMELKKQVAELERKSRA